MSDYIRQAAAITRSKLNKKGYRKYRNTELTFDGRNFDSKAEMRVYLKLKAQIQNQEIVEVECQPKIELFPDPIVKGRHVTYIADFRVVRNDGTEFFIDVKGEETARETTYRLKIKCVKWFFPDLELREYVYGARGLLTENVY